MSGLVKTMLKKISLGVNADNIKVQRNVSPFFFLHNLIFLFLLFSFWALGAIFELSGLKSKFVAHPVQKNALFFNHVSINPVINIKIHSSVSNSLKHLQTIIIMLISSIVTGFLYTTQNSCYSWPRRWIFKN